MAARLKDGLNDLLGRMEIPGCASGVASLIFLKLGIDHECDKEVCNLPPADLHRLYRSPIKNPATLSMFNHDVDGFDRYILSAAHTEQDIDHTIEAMEKTLTELREDGLL